MIEQPNKSQSPAMRKTLEFDVDMDMATLFEVTLRTGWELRSPLARTLDGGSPLPGRQRLVLLQRNLLQFLPIQGAGVDRSVGGEEQARVLLAAIDVFMAILDFDLLTRGGIHIL